MKTSTLELDKAERRRGAKEKAHRDHSFTHSGSPQNNNPEAQYLLKTQTCADPVHAASASELTCALIMLI